MIRDLTSAIRAVYNANANSALSNIVGGGLWFTEAKQNVSEPYIVFSFVSTTTNPYFSSATKNIEVVDVQFTIVSRNEDALVEVGNIEKQLDTVFNNATLTYQTATHLLFEKTGSVQPIQYDDVTMATSLYRAHYEN